MHGNDLSWRQVFEIITLQYHNVRVVVLGVTLLGLASGVVGTFLLLRRRALVSDALSHATLPGIAIAFLVMSSFGGSGRWLLRFSLDRGKNQREQ